eukprot:SAG22_NODE_19_length_32182_cov_39.206963_18_plen_255_part_00
MDESVVDVDGGATTPQKQRWKGESVELVHVASECLHSVPVPADMQCEIKLDVVQNDTNLGSTAQDISVTGFFRSADKSNTVEIFRVEQVDKHRAAYTAAVGGDLVFLFDNTYSWFNEKDVQVDVTIGTKLVQSSPSPSPAALAMAAALERDDMSHGADNPGDALLKSISPMPIHGNPPIGGDDLGVQVAHLTDVVSSLMSANKELEATNSKNWRLLQEKDALIADLTAKNDSLKSGLADKVAAAMAAMAAPSTS